ncbi:MAG: hypothetical protein WB660_24215 [Candidatus Sulfotelmatobacter sp.]
MGRPPSNRGQALRAGVAFLQFAVRKSILSSGGAPCCADFSAQNGKVTEVYSKDGEARWFPPFKHKVENLGDEAYNAVYVGIKGKLATSAADPAHDSTMSLEQLAKLLDYAQAAAKP